MFQDPFNELLRLQDFNGDFSVFQGCLKNASGCFKNVSRMFQECFKDVSRKLHDFFTNASNVLKRRFQKCFKQISRLFQWSSKCESRVFQTGSFKGVSILFWRCFNEDLIVFYGVSGKLHGYFLSVSMKYQGGPQDPQLYFGFWGFFLCPLVSMLKHIQNKGVIIDHVEIFLSKSWKPADLRRFFVHRAKKWKSLRKFFFQNQNPYNSVKS